MSDGGRAEEQKAGRAEENIRLSSPETTVKRPDLAGNGLFFSFKIHGFEES